MVNVFRGNLSFTKEESQEEIVLKQPSQQRAIKRVRHVLEVARAILVERGLEGLSIPDVAARAGVSRASVYQYYPSKYDLIYAVADDCMAEIIGQIESLESQFKGQQPLMILRQLLQIGQVFFNSSSVGSLLILGWPMSIQGAARDNSGLKRLSNYLRFIYTQSNPPLAIPASPDLMHFMMSQTLGMYRHSYLEYGRMTDELLQEAERSMGPYLISFATTVAPVAPSESPSTVE